MGFPTGAILVCGEPGLVEALRVAADAAGVPLWYSPAPLAVVLDRLDSYRHGLEASTVVHGELLEVFGMGLLITGGSGVGKSELALELISRGHRLVADDTPTLTRVAPDILEGACPPTLSDLLEVRGLGILNIRRMFGDSAIKRNKRVRLIVHLVKLEDIAPPAESRLQGMRDTRVILGVERAGDHPADRARPQSGGAGGMRGARSHPAAGGLLRRAGFDGARGKSHGEGRPMRIIIVSGLSGSGKTIALQTLEDLDYYCVDNLPFKLILPLAREILASSDIATPAVAVGVDARNFIDELHQFPATLAELRASDLTVEVLFLQADDEILLKRYSETRRRHPLDLGSVPLREAIRAGTAPAGADRRLRRPDRGHQRDQHLPVARTAPRPPARYAARGDVAAVRILRFQERRAGRRRFRLRRPLSAQSALGAAVAAR